MLSLSLNSSDVCRVPAPVPGNFRAPGEGRRNLSAGDGQGGCMTVSGQRCCNGLVWPKPGKQGFGQMPKITIGSSHIGNSVLPSIHRPLIYCMTRCYLKQNLYILPSSVLDKGCTRVRLGCAGEEQRLGVSPHVRSPGPQRRSPTVRLPGVEESTEEQGVLEFASHLA